MTAVQRLDYAKKGVAVEDEQLLRSLDFICLELTLKCNLECVHCYSSSNMLMKDDFKTEDWVRILEQGAKLGCRQVQLIGGEPTLFRDLLLLVEKSRELGYRFIELYTNATLLTDAQLDELKSHNVHIATSFYSHLPETHDAITQRKGSFERTVGAIKLILSKRMPLRVGIIKLPQNQNQIGDTFMYLMSLGVSRDNIELRPVRGVGRGAQLVREKDEYSAFCGTCWRGILAVSSDGAVYPCTTARKFEVGDITRESLEDILKKQELADFLKVIYDRYELPRKSKNLASEPKNKIQPFLSQFRLKGALVRNFIRSLS